MVSTEVTSISNCKKSLKITIPAAEISKIRDQQFKVVQKEAQIQGFRKGRAPRHMVQNYYQGTIEKYTLDAALQKGYEDGLRESKVIPIAEPEFKNFDYDSEKNLVMEVDVEIYPEIELKKYTGIKIEKEVFKIDNEDVDNSINYLRKQKATIAPVEGHAEEGHYVTVTMQEVDETGFPLVGKKYDDIRIQLGENKFDPDIEKQVLGLKVGDEKVVEKVYDEKIAQKNLAGKRERYRVKIEKIENEELPELNDVFIKELNYENVDNIEDLQNQIRKNLEAHWGQESEQRFYHKMAHELLQLNSFNVPDSVVERYLDQMVEDIRNRDKNVDIEAVRKNYRTDAVFNIKWFYLKEKIAEAENLRAEEEDFNKYLESVEDNKLRDLYRQNKDLKKRIMNDIFEKKIFDFLLDNSKIKIEEKSIRKDTALL